MFLKNYVIHFLFCVVLVAKINDDYCTGDSELGVCKSSYSCMKQNWTNLRGSCGAYNLGVCCLPTFTPILNEIPVIVKEKVSVLKTNKKHLVNSFHFPKLNGSCQIRLNFKESLAPPKDGSCMDDSFSVLGSVTVQDFVLCGSIPHPLYLSYGSSEAIKLEFRSVTGKEFEVKVQHIDCNSIEKVDDHCLMSYGMPSGQVKSFGWNGVMGYQITGLEYNICVGKKAGSKPLTWKMCNVGTEDPLEKGNTNSFYTTHNFGNYQGRDQACSGKTSYVSIPGVGTFCGGYFPEVSGANLNMIIVKTVKEDFSKYKAKEYYPLIVQDVPDAPDDCSALGNFHIFKFCMLIPGDLKLLTCACSSEADATEEKAHPSLLGFCLEYGPM